MRIFSFFFATICIVLILTLRTHLIFAQLAEPPENIPVAGSGGCGQGDICYANICTDASCTNGFTVTGVTTYAGGYIYITAENGVTYIVGTPSGNSGGGNGGSGGGTGGGTGGGSGGTGGGNGGPPPPPPPPNDPPPCAESGNCTQNPSLPPGSGGTGGICNQSCYSNSDCAYGYYCSGFTGSCRATACPNDYTCGCNNTPPAAACNQYCTGGNDCASGYCYGATCRNISCPIDATCLCGNTATPTLPSGVTATPTSTPIPTNTVTPTQTPTPIPEQCTISATGNPGAVSSGQTSTILWTATNAAGTCSVFGPGFQADSLPTSGSVTTGPLTQYNNVFYVSCFNSANENCSSSVTFAVSQVQTCNSSCRSDSNCPSGLSCINSVCRNSACSNDGDCNCSTTNTPTPPLTPTPPQGCNTICRASSDCTPYNSGYMCLAGNCRNNACTSAINCSCGPGPGTNTPTPTPVEPPYACFRTGCIGSNECLAPADTCMGGTCVNIACTANSTCVCNGRTGTNTPTPIGGTSGSGSRTVTGTVYSDALLNNCSSGAAPLGNARVQVVNDSDSSLVGIQSSDGAGHYPAITSDTVNSAHILVGNIGTQIVTGVRDGAATFSPLYSNGVGYGFNWQANPTKTIDFCIGTGSTSWYQTSIGDVRYHTIVNPVANRSLATNSTPPSNFFSSTTTNIIPAGRLSTNNWQVNREYNDYNSVSILGSTSYSFYSNQISRVGITPQTVNILPTTLTTGASQGFYLKDGNLTIDQPLSIPAGNTVVLLVNGDVDIRSTITVASGSIFILAAKGNITVQPSVGNGIGVDDATTAPLQGVFTAEENITILSNASCPGTEDLRLNVSGSLIANSLRPFASNGNGRVINQRTLCSNNLYYPSLKVYLRPNFATGLSTILKSQSRKWSENK